MKSSSIVLFEVPAIASKVATRINFFNSLKKYFLVMGISLSFFSPYTVSSLRAKIYLLIQHVLRLVIVKGDYWAHEMWPVQIETCNKCKIHTEFQRVSMTKVENLMNTYYTDYLLIFGYHGLNKMLLKWISSVSHYPFDTVTTRTLNHMWLYYFSVGQCGSTVCVSTGMWR